MKTAAFFSGFAVLLALTSCSVSTYYQVYKAVSVENMLPGEKTLFFEDKNCKVFYNLWNNGGDIGFRLYNKTTQNIYIDLTESFFIKNGIASCYYQNRIFSKYRGLSSASSNSSSIDLVNSESTSRKTETLSAISVNNTVGVGLSMTNSVSYVEEKILAVPPKSSVIISEFRITNSLYRDCKLYKYPLKEGIITEKFTETNSPLLFTNRILYRVGESPAPLTVENNFYVSEITNYPENELIYSEYESFCEKTGSNWKYHFEVSAPDMFYLEYQYSPDGLKH